MRCECLRPESEMQKLGRYTGNDLMSDLVTDNYRILLTMSRFGIGLGFGDKRIEEVCRENDVDTETFLTVANMLLGDDLISTSTVSIECLIEYLQNSHKYFLGFRLPAIRSELIAIVGASDDALGRAIIQYFDQYVKGVNDHMLYEERVVFPYVMALMDGVKPDGYCIKGFRDKHDQVESLLTEFKNIQIKYYQ